MKRTHVRPSIRKAERKLVHKTAYPDTPYSCKYVASRCACGRKKSPDFGACWLCANGAVAEHLGLTAKLPRAPYRAPSFGSFATAYDKCLCGNRKSCDFDECYDCKSV